MADPAKYCEVKYLHGQDAQQEVNGLLRVGWEVITSKIVETKKIGEPHYILGKRRDYKSPEQIRKDQEERDRLYREGR